MTTHLIRFSSEADYRRAVAALSDVPVTRVGLPGYKMAVTQEHLDALDRVGIPYQDLTKDATSGAATSVQP